MKRERENRKAAAGEEGRCSTETSAAIESPDSSDASELGVTLFLFPFSRTLCYTHTHIQRGRSLPPPKTFAWCLDRQCLAARFPSLLPITCSSLCHQLVQQPRQQQYLTYPTARVFHSNGTPSAACCRKTAGKRRKTRSCDPSYLRGTWFLLPNFCISS